eukprot:1158084-Pelagomonas_calceolata.AAC.13
MPYGVHLSAVVLSAWSDQATRACGMLMQPKENMEAHADVGKHYERVTGNTRTDRPFEEDSRSKCKYLAFPCLAKRQSYMWRLHPITRPQSLSPRMPILAAPSLISWGAPACNQGKRLKPSPLHGPLPF